MSRFTPGIAQLAAMMPLRLDGLRITKLENGERVECWRYRPNVLAARQAAADVKWLQMRNPAAEYKLEEITMDGPLVLDADEPKEDANGAG